VRAQCRSAITAHALYYFAGDHKAGDITGEELNQFGGGWDVISPGNKIEGGG
jgi:predicted lipoprotein with Yx(FWY)xxD motif